IARTNYFDGDGPSKRPITGEIHLSHAAATQDLFNLVTVQEELAGGQLAPWFHGSGNVRAGDLVCGSNMSDRWRRRNRGSRQARHRAAFRTPCFLADKGVLYLARKTATSAGEGNHWIARVKSGSRRSSNV